jgi:hypothetical protein
MIDDNRISGELLSVDHHFFDVCQIPDYDGLLKKHLTDRERDVLCYRYGLNGYEKKTQVKIAGLCHWSQVKLNGRLSNWPLA